jgi:hypothetical protein
MVVVRLGGPPPELEAAQGALVDEIARLTIESVPEP